MARKYRSKEEMHTMYERFKMSELSIDAFCNQEGINKHTFLYWRKKLTEKQVAPSVKKAVSFLPISPPGILKSEAIVTIHLADNISIELPHSYSPVQIASFIKAIRRC